MAGITTQADRIALDSIPGDVLLDAGLVDAEALVAAFAQVLREF